MLGNRAIYHLGWTAVAKHKDPWLASDHGLDDDVWELYNVEEDWTQSNDLAAEHPEKLAELQRLFLIQAARFNVLPLDIRSAERFNPDIAGRPQLHHGHDADALPRHEAAQRERRRSTSRTSRYTVTADVDGARERRRRRVIAQGGAYGGWSVYATDGRLKYSYNLLGIETYIVRSDDPVPAGDQEVRAHFAYDGGGVGKGGTVTLYAGDAQIGEGRVERTIPFMFSMDETADVGSDLASPVSTDYGADRQRVHRDASTGCGSTSATTTTATSSTRSTGSPSR